MAQGSVKWFNTEKGYGFIDPDGPSDNVFVHFSAVVDHTVGPLQDGDRVEFEIVQGAKGPQAANVRRI